MECLDTTVLIDLLRGSEQAKKLRKTLVSKHLFTTELNVYEVVSGIFAKKKGNKQQDLEKAEELFHRVTILPLTHRAALRAGEINGNLLLKGEIIEDIDILTASIALANGVMTIVTRNAKHFQRIPGLVVKTY